MDEFRLILQDWLRSRDIQIILLACLAICFAGITDVKIWENDKLTYAHKMALMGLMGVVMLVCIGAIIAVIGR